MNGLELAATIQERVKALLPECHFVARFDYGIYPSIYMQFAKGKDRAAWSNGIIQNDNYFMLASIDGFEMAEYVNQTPEIKAGKLKGDKVTLKSISNNAHKTLPLRGTTATPEKMVEYIMKYFLKVKVHAPIA